MLKSVPSKGGIHTAPLSPLGDGKGRCFPSPTPLHLGHLPEQSKISTTDVETCNFQDSTTNEGKSRANTLQQKQTQ